MRRQSDDDDDDGDDGGDDEGGDIAGFSLERHRQSIHRFLDIGIQPTTFGRTQLSRRFPPATKRKINRIGL